MDFINTMQYNMLNYPNTYHIIFILIHLEVHNYIIIYLFASALVNVVELFRHLTVSTHYSVIQDPAHFLFALAHL